MKSFTDPYELHVCLQRERKVHLRTCFENRQQIKVCLEAEMLPAVPPILPGEGALYLVRMSGSAVTTINQPIIVATPGNTAVFVVPGETEFSLKRAFGIIQGSFRACSLSGPFIHTHQIFGKGDTLHTETGSYPQLSIQECNNDNSRTTLASMFEFSSAVSEGPARVTATVSTSGTFCTVCQPRFFQYDVYVRFLNIPSDDVTVRTDLNNIDEVTLIEEFHM